MPVSGDFVVLVVDPDDADAAAAREALLADGSPVADLRVEVVPSFEAATSAIEDLEPDCIVTEYDLGGHSGLDLLELVRARTPDAACILYTDSTPEGIRTKTFEDVIVEYLPKSLPEAPVALARLVRNVLSQRSQIAYPLPETEDERLAALDQYDVDNLAASTTVDRLTELVANHFDVAVAFAGVVDAHEERFLACHGADWERLDREDTICTHTLLEDDFLVVENVQADSRFSGVATLEDLAIRSYAGVPLRTPEGLPIGALCLIHDEPRSYSEAELSDLQLFAEELMEQLELRRRLRDEPEATPGEANR